MSASLCHNEDEASSGAVFLNHVSLKIGKINLAVLSTLLQLSEETRYFGGGWRVGATVDSTSFMKSFAQVLKTDFIFL